ncbi:hypothetical protein H6G93_19140 [Nostoc sp. FACHB-973]|nr:hypothetical protein [Nostoc sp. FACHB-973]MBX9254162.1 hypothetical protein [Desmonostoc muscorum CCALA 125]
MTFEIPQPQFADVSLLDQETLLTIASPWAMPYQHWFFLAHQFAQTKESSTVLSCN